MGDEDREQPQNPREIQEFLQRLSRDKHAFGAHLGMRVERDFTDLEKRERQWLAARERNKRKKP